MVPLKALALLGPGSGQTPMFKGVKVAIKSEDPRVEAGLREILAGRALIENLAT